MTHKETAEKISALLLGGASLAPNWVAPPEVMHIPFMGNRESFFLLVSIYIKQEPGDREALVSECLSVACSAIRSGFLADEKAVEIAAYVEDQKKLRRVARLTVLEAAFDQALKAKAADALAQRIEGIACQWPLQPPQ